MFYTNTHNISIRNFLSSDNKFDIIRYISKGLSSDKIADILGITTNTCRIHRKNIFRKIGCHSVASLIKTATDLGFLSQA